MVAFAALPGQVAYDGVERDSPFTSSLVAHLATPDLEIGIAFKRVIRDVRDKTGGRQSPQIVSNLSAELYLGIGGAGHTISPSAAPSPKPADQPGDQPTDQLAMARVVPGRGPPRRPGCRSSRSRSMRRLLRISRRPSGSAQPAPGVCSLHAMPTARWPGRRCKIWARPIRSSPRSSRSWGWR